MLTLILAVILGAGFAFLATQNTALITLHAGIYTWTFPLYLIALGSLMAGVLAAWVFNLGGWLSSTAMISDKDRQIRDDEKTISNLQKEIHDLEEENEKLRMEAREKTHEATHHQGESLGDRLRHRLSF
ncbi:DUF1049 domain-containing protein [Candidatus Microgenomates bacterium]|nr:DUF1049 domain-containing protein [Candidatus Microgenomates bacterium]